MDNLREHELTKFSDIYNIYAKTEGSFMKFNDLLFLLIEKRVLSNKITIDKIHPIYEKAIAHNIEVKETVVAKSDNKKKKKEAKTKE